MKKNLFYGLVFAACVALASCGGGGSGTAEQTSPDLTNEEQVASSEMIMGEQSISNGIENALMGGVSAMVTDAIKSKNGLKDTTTATVTCAMGGTITITASGSGTARTYTVTLDNCAGLMETPGGVGITFSITGVIEISGSTVTFGAGGGDIVVLWACVVGGSAFHTCHMSGTTSGGEGGSATYHLSGYCGSTNFTHTGSLTGTMRDADHHFLMSGHAVYTITGTSSGRIVRCNYSEFDVTAATCADFATACGLSPTIACSSECHD